MSCFGARHTRVYKKHTLCMSERFGLVLSSVIKLLAVIATL